MPQRDAQLIPWEEVNCDLIGLWKLKVPGQEEEVEFYALTCIEPVIYLTELVHIQAKTAAHAGMHFENCWLSYYPKPETCVHDPGL